jgi:dipeptidase E
MKLLLLSSSTVHGMGYLDHAMADIRRVFDGAKEVLFIPFALPDWAEYARRVQERLMRDGISIRSLHEESDRIAALESAAAIFVGGGNTLVLLRELYEQHLLEPLRDRVHEGAAYVGSSAGANIAGVSIKTTNDMPIVFPPSLHALEVVPFNLNPHYRDRDPSSTFKGEARDERIHQFHRYDTTPVVALREPALLEVREHSMRIRGARARYFRPDVSPVEIDPDDEFRPLVDFAK